MTLSLDVYKNQQKELSSERDRLAPLITAGDLMTLDQRLILLDRLGTEMCEQVTLRRTQVKGQLERWLYFEEQCRRLMENIAKCESAVVAYNDLPIDDVIVLLQTVSGFMFHCL